MQKRSGTKYPLAKRQNLLPVKIGAASALAVLIVTLFSVSSISRVFVGNSEYAAVISAVLVDLVNQDRASDSIGSLSVSPVLVAAAQAKANDMAAKGYFAHVSPEGLDSWYWFRQQGYAFTYAGENLAADFSDSADVEKAWLASPTHRANLLNPHFTEIGIATAEGTYQGHPTTFVVQMFGAPTIGKAPVATANIHPLTVPQNATEPAIVTTESSSSQNVLGASANPTPKVATAPKATKAHTVIQAEALASSSEEAAASVPVVVEKQAPFWGFAVSAPKTMLRYAYYILGLIILIALLARTGIEIKRHHVRHIAIASGLAVLMLALFFVADHLIFTMPALNPAASSIQS